MSGLHEFGRCIHLLPYICQATGQDLVSWQLAHVLVKIGGIGRPNFGFRLSLFHTSRFDFLLFLTHLRYRKQTGLVLLENAACTRFRALMVVVQHVVGSLFDRALHDHLIESTLGVDVTRWFFLERGHITFVAESAIL